MINALSHTVNQPASKSINKKLFFQPKLAINQPNDIYEQEANAMADKVMRMPDISMNNNSFFKPSITPIQRKCAHCEEEQMQRKEVNTNETIADTSTEKYISSLDGKGRSLTQNERSFFEPRFGYDFSNVQLHTNSEANQSAESINALAYTHGSHIVFGSNQYEPGTDTGKRLMSHELTHVVQQQGLNASKVTNVNQPLISKQSNQPQQTPAGGCTQAQMDMINAARTGAFVRCQTAYQRLAGIGVPAPPGREDPAQDWQRRARDIAHTIFGTDLNMDQVTEIVGSMRNKLATPDLPVVCSPASDSNCGNRAGYVINFSNPIHVCAAFFSSTAEERIRTMIHESAHLSGIGEAIGESYCGVYDCNTSCGGFNAADSWAHYVHCLSGQTPDSPIVIKGKNP